MNLLNGIKNVFNIIINNRKEPDINTFLITTTRKFTTESNNHYGIYVSKEGEYSTSFRNRLNNLFFSKYYLIIYYIDNNKSDIEILISNNLDDFEFVKSNNLLLLQERLIEDIFFRDFFFESKEIAEKFENIIKTNIQKEIDEKYQEYLTVKNKKNEWLK